MKPSGDTAGQVQHGQLGVFAFLRAHQDAAEAVMPGMRPLHPPAPSLIAGLMLHFLLAVVARSHMQGHAEVFGYPPHFFIVVAGI